MRLLHDEPIAAHTTMRVGGPAARMVVVETPEHSVPHCIGTAVPTAALRVSRASEAVTDSLQLTSPQTIRPAGGRPMMSPPKHWTGQATAEIVPTAL